MLLQKLWVTGSDITAAAAAGNTAPHRSMHTVLNNTSLLLKVLRVAKRSMTIFQKAYVLLLRNACSSAFFWKRFN